MKKIETRKFSTITKQPQIKDYACPLSKKEMIVFIELIEKISEQAKGWKIDMWFWTVDMKFKCKSSEVE